MLVFSLFRFEFHSHAQSFTVIYSYLQRGPAAGTGASSGGSSGSAFTSSSPTRSSGFGDSERGSLSYNEPADSFPEIPTDLAKLIYNRVALHERKVPMSRLPDAETVSAMKSCSVWTDTAVSAQSLAQTLPSGPYLGPSRDSRNKGGMNQQKNRNGPGGQAQGGNNSRNNGGASGSGAGPGSNSGRNGSPSGKQSTGFGSGGATSPIGTAKSGEGAKRPQKKRDEQELFFGQIQSLLNKLTLEKFDKLCDKLVELFKQIDSPDIFAESVELVHKKALTEPHFCSMYSDLCERLSKASPEFPDPDGGKKPISFSKVILNDCQKVFLERLPVGDVAEEAMTKARKRILGNLVFIGELYKRALIHQNIVQRCVNDLVTEVQKGTAQFTDEHPPVALVEATENNIEKLCKLVIAVAKFWESKNPSNKAWMDHIFELLKDFASDKHLNPRTRFLARDVIDMRLNGWVPRRKVEGPQKLDDIKLQAELEYDGILVQENAPLKTVPLVEFEKRGRENDAQRARAASGGSGTGASASSTATTPAKVGAAAAARLGPAPAVEDEDVALEALQEFLTSGDLNELSISVREMKSLDKFVSTAVDWAFQRLPATSAALYTQISNAFAALHSTKALNSDHFVQGFESLSSSLDDIVVDVPHAAQILGLFVGRSLKASILTQAQIDAVVGRCPLEPLRAKLSDAIALE